MRISEKEVLLWAEGVGYSKMKDNLLTLLTQLLNKDYSIEVARTECISQAKDGMAFNEYEHTH